MVVLYSLLGKHIWMQREGVPRAKNVPFFWSRHTVRTVAKSSDRVIHSLRRFRRVSRHDTGDQPRLGRNEVSPFAGPFPGLRSVARQVVRARIFARLACVVAERWA